MPSGRTKISPKGGRGLGHVTSTIFGSTVGYPSDSLASCILGYVNFSCIHTVLAMHLVLTIITLHRASTHSVEVSEQFLNGTSAH